MKNYLILILALIIQMPVISAETINDLLIPKPSFYRLGTTDMPEIPVDMNIQPDILPVVKKEPEVNEKQTVTYADLSIKSMAMEISKSLELDFDDMQGDLSLLWQGAATNSDTIKFAIYKLSNPDKDKPDTNAVKKVLTTIAGMSTMVGAGMGNPVLASASLIGGNTLGIFSQDTKALNYKYTQVTDADMIILVRKVEELQQKVVDMYYDYMSSRKLFELTSSMVTRSHDNYKAAQNLSKEVVLMTDTFYREAMDENQKARGNFFEKRSRLEQLVGAEIFRDFEKNVDERESASTEKS